MKIEEIQKENNRRLDILYRTKNDWLMSAAYNITKNRELAKELVAELYSYIAERGNPNIWYGTDDFNMMYLHSFLRTRHINMVKSNGKVQTISDTYDEVDENYDEELDTKIQQSYDEIVDEIQQLQKTKMWSSARLAELYFFSGDKMTLDKLSKDIGISKSTSFLNVKKIKQHIRMTKKNPFRN
jgi:DNA-binding transcriptional regulator GbsR (MarR family)